MAVGQEEENIRWLDFIKGAIGMSLQGAEQHYWGQDRMDINNL